MMTCPRAFSRGDRVSAGRAVKFLAALPFGAASPQIPYIITGPVYAGISTNFLSYNSKCSGGRAGRGPAACCPASFAGNRRGLAPLQPSLPIPSHPALPSFFSISIADAPMVWTFMLASMVTRTFFALLVYFGPPSVWSYGVRARSMARVSNDSLDDPLPRDPALPTASVWPSLSSQLHSCLTLRNRRAFRQRLSWTGAVFALLYTGTIFLGMSGNPGARASPSALPRWDSPHPTLPTAFARRRRPPSAPPAENDCVEFLPTHPP